MKLCVILYDVHYMYHVYVNGRYLAIIVLCASVLTGWTMVCSNQSSI